MKQACLKGVISSKFECDVSEIVNTPNFQTYPFVKESVVNMPFFSFQSEAYSLKIQKKSKIKI